MEREVCKLLITPHVLLGAALAKRTDSLLWGIPLAFASHFMLDAIPNWDVGLTSARNIGIVITDGIIALLLLRFLSLSRQGICRDQVLLWVGGFFGILPDLLSQGCGIIGIQKWIPFENLHQGIQRSAHVSWSLPMQILLSTIFAGWIYYMTRYISCIGNHKRRLSVSHNERLNSDFKKQ